MKRECPPHLHIILGKGENQNSVTTKNHLNKIPSIIVCNVMIQINLIKLLHFFLSFSFPSIKPKDVKKLDNPITSWYFQMDNLSQSHFQS